MRDGSVRPGMYGERRPDGTFDIAILEARAGRQFSPEEIQAAFARRHVQPGRQRRKADQEREAVRRAQALALIEARDAEIIAHLKDVFGLDHVELPPTKLL